VVIAFTLAPEATAALIGAAVGSVGSWGLAWTTDVARARRDRKTAALLIATELTVMGAAISALRATNTVSPPLPDLRRPLWEAHGKALLYGADLSRAGVLERAYSASADVAAISAEPDRDFTDGFAAKMADTAVEEVIKALRVVLLLAGLPAREVARRTAGAQAHHETR